MKNKDENFPMAGKRGGMGGKYGRKAENLSASELKKAGGAKAAAARKVDISQTKRDTTRGITLGPKGKPLTGSVTLANGSTAVYKNGKRVVKAAAAKKAVSAVRKDMSGGKDTPGKKETPAKKMVSYTPGRKQGAGSRTSELLKKAKAERPVKTPYAAGGGMGSGPSKNSKGPRRAGESVQAYNDRIRNAPLSDLLSKFKFGSGGKTVNSGKGPYSK